MKRTFLWIFMMLTVCSFACSAAKPLAKHVVLIGLDGWGAYSVEKADMPHVKKLMAEGTYTLTKRSVLPSSSAVNWASMFMGAGPELHGFTEWGSQKPDLPSRELSHYGLFPSVWGLFRDAYPTAEMGYIYEWEGMKYLAEMQAMNYTQHTPVCLFLNKVDFWSQPYLKKDNKRTHNSWIRISGYLSGKPYLCLQIKDKPLYDDEPYD